MLITWVNPEINWIFENNFGNFLFLDSKWIEINNFNV